MTLRTDVILRDLMAYLDAKVGKGNYVLALSADHGVCPLPEVSQAKGPLQGTRTTPAPCRWGGSARGTQLTSKVSRRSSAESRTCSRNNAATPETMGVANDVPLTTP